MAWMEGSEAMLMFVNYIIPIKMGQLYGEILHVPFLTACECQGDWSIVRC